MFFFDEEKYLEHPFQSNLQRYRFFSELHLTVPIDIFRFCPDGSVVSSVCVVPAREKRSEQEILVDGARFALKKQASFQGISHQSHETSI